MANVQQQVETTKRQDVQKGKVYLLENKLAKFM